VCTQWIFIKFELIFVVVNNHNRNVKLLETLSAKQLQTVSRCLVNTAFSEGETIIKQGELGVVI
jgi:hypothetical protein